MTERHTFQGLFKDAPVPFMLSVCVFWQHFLQKLQAFFLYCTQFSVHFAFKIDFTVPERMLRVARLSFDLNILLNLLIDATVIYFPLLLLNQQILFFALSFDHFNRLARPAERTLPNGPQHLIAVVTEDETSEEDLHVFFESDLDRIVEQIQRRALLNHDNVGQFNLQFRLLAKE